MYFKMNRNRNVKIVFWVLHKPQVGNTCGISFFYFTTLFSNVNIFIFVCLNLLVALLNFHFGSAIKPPPFCVSGNHCWSLASRNINILSLLLFCEAATQSAKERLLEISLPVPSLTYCNIFQNGKMTFTHVTFHYLHFYSTLLVCALLVNMA